jgi:hypothetical protein
MVTLLRDFRPKSIIEISGSHGGECEDDGLLGCYALIMEVVSTTEMSVNFYDTTRRNLLQDSLMV